MYFPLKMGIFHGYVSLAGGNTLNPKMEVDGYVMTFLTQIEVIFRLQPLGFREKNRISVQRFITSWNSNGAQ